MINEANSDLTHTELVSYTRLHLRSAQAMVFTEFRLPHGKRADVLTYGIDQTVSIYECKDRLTADELLKSFDRYYGWCNAFWLVINQSERSKLREFRFRKDTAMAIRQMGLALCDRRRLELIDTAKCHPLDTNRLLTIADRVGSTDPDFPRMGGRMVRFNP